MRILIQGPCLANYLAKCHEALRTGLRATFDARCFGKGYPRYYPAALWIRTFPQIAKHLFKNESVDWMFTQHIHGATASFLQLQYAAMDQVSSRKAILLADYWELHQRNHDALAEFVSRWNIDLVFSYFIQPLTIWRENGLAEKLLFLPPSFDPAIFNDWQLEKTYDVGFLAAGTVDPSDIYPERSRIHQKLLSQKDLKYLWAGHPGWKLHVENAPLVGKNFSKAINSCRVFVTTGGIYRNAHAKYIEALASHTLLLAEEPEGAEQIGLLDGVNYVKITENDVVDKLRYYLSNESLREQIAGAGYRFAMNKHNCYVRAEQFGEACMDVDSGSR